MSFLSLCFACGSNENGGSNGGSGGSTSTGGTPGATGGSGNGGGGGDGTGGSDGSTGGGTGTGGSTNTTGGIVPGTDHYDCSPPSGELPQLELAPYVTELDNPVYVTHAPGELDRLFVLEQAGTIQVVRDGNVGAAPFLDISSQVDLATWEQGLLGLAFHPDYATNGLFYVHFTGLNVSGHETGSAIIAEYKVSDADPDVADPASERIVFGAPTTNGYHNGGSIFFGLENHLFIGLGDGAGAIGEDGDFRVLAQDLTSYRGKLLRIDPMLSGSDPYTVPAGNLVDIDSEAAPEIWSYGLRNPYRSNIDACTGDIYIGDVGDRSWEEVNVEASGTGHHNYGWPILEGDECFDAETCDEPDGYRPPVAAHPNQMAGGPQFQAVIGGTVYRGSAIPALRGTYFYSDLYGNTRTFTYNATTDSISDIASLESQLNPAETDQGLVAIQNGGDGEIYFVSRGGSGMGIGATGVIYRLQAAN